MTGKSEGKVYLVGAGPGDPGLITLRGLEALREADVIVYDRLVDDRLLDQCRKGAILKYVGKKAGAHSVKQDSINSIMVRYARLGKRIVRLKGGDPFVLGRGSEEAMALALAKVRFEVVPGVTSASAVPAFAGIPLTHRGVSSSVSILTGHEDPEKEKSSIRWDKISDATDTVVCLMSLGNIRQICLKLVEGGRKSDTPCAVIESGTLPRQRIIVGSLGNIFEKCAKEDVQSPALLVVGEVVRLREWLGWFEKKPLYGMRMALTGPSHRASSLEKLLESYGAEVVKLPAIELSQIKMNGLFDKTVRELENVDWVFFTSPDGISMLAHVLSSKKKDLRFLKGCHIAAIGPKTADSIRAFGIHVDFVPDEFSQEGILEGMSKRNISGKTALLLNSKDSRTVLEKGLEGLGMEVSRIAIYRTLMPKDLNKRVSIAFKKRIDMVVITSSSAALNFADAFRRCFANRNISDICFASIGPVSSQTIRDCGGKVCVEASKSTIEGMAEKIVSWALKVKKVDEAHKSRRD